jgi:hypothetical protein
MIKRNKTGHFLPIGEKTKTKPHFNQRYVTVRTHKIALDKAYLLGFRNGKKAKTTTAEESLHGVKMVGLLCVSY